VSVIDTSVKGKRHGDLVAQYQVGRRVACRCHCQRLVFFADEELTSGAATSCGCSAPSLARVTQLKHLGAELRRAITFNIARGR
jgi:hypothetical protein